MTVNMNLCDLCETELLYSVTFQLIIFHLVCVCECVSVSVCVCVCVCVVINTADVFLP